MSPVKRGWLCEGVFEGAVAAVNGVAKGNPDREATIVNVPKFMRVDFSSLRIPQYDYVTQAVTKPCWAWLLIVCPVHCNSDFGLCARNLGGKYTAKWRDAKSIPVAVKGLISDVDLDHMRLILNHSCLPEFKW
jgi:hypothetical protein